MSRYYIDKGAHRTFRYEARGSFRDTGYALGSYRTKEEALEAALEHKRRQESWRKDWAPGDWE